MKYRMLCLAASLVLATVFCAPALPAQSLNVLYSFAGPPDGANPVAGVTFDTHGHLYGTAQRGGQLDCLLDGCGTVFELMRNSGGGWTEQQVNDFAFTGFYGGTPMAPVIIDSMGNLYGTFACTFDCFGTHGGGIFTLLEAGGNWTPLTVAGYWGSVTGECQDGGCGVGFGPSGRLYATTADYYGPFGNNGAVLYLGRQSVRGWFTLTIYVFRGGNDGSTPSEWFSFGADDSIFSTTLTGGAPNAGTVFELQNSGGAQWHETQLYVFQGGADGAYPAYGVIFDGAGNLYGTTTSGGSSNLGTVFKLTHNSNGTWTKSTLWSFAGGGDAANPTGPLTFDSVGNLYGVAGGGGALGHGAIYKLIPDGDGNWTESVPYSFSGGTDGDGPSGQLVLDSAGNLYGTTVKGGTHPMCSDEPYCGGVVFQLVP